MNSSMSTVFNNTSTITFISASVSNLSSNFWNLSAVVNNLSFLPSTVTNLSTAFWIDHKILGDTVSTLSSASQVAWNAWDAIIHDSSGINPTLSNLSTNYWKTNTSLSNLSTVRNKEFEFVEC